MNAENATTPRTRAAAGEVPMVFTSARRRVPSEPTGCAGKAVWYSVASLSLRASTASFGVLSVPLYCGRAAAQCHLHWESVSNRTPRDRGKVPTPVSDYGFRRDYL